MRDGAADLAADEILAAPRGFVIEEDAVAYAYEAARSARDIDLAFLPNLGVHASPKPEFTSLRPPTVSD